MEQTFEARFTIVDIDMDEINDGDYSSCYYIHLHNHPTQGDCYLWAGTDRPNLKKGQTYKALMTKAPKPCKLFCCPFHYFIFAKPC